MRASSERSLPAADHPHHVPVLVIAPCSGVSLSCNEPNPLVDVSYRQDRRIFHDLCPGVGAALGNPPSWLPHIRNPAAVAPPEAGSAAGIRSQLSWCATTRSRSMRFRCMVDMQAVRRVKRHPFVDQLAYALQMETAMHKSTLWPLRRVGCLMVSYNKGAGGFHGAGASSTSAATRLWNEVAAAAFRHFRIVTAPAKGGTSSGTRRGLLRGLAAAEAHGGAAALGGGVAAGGTSTRGRALAAEVADADPDGEEEEDEEASMLAESKAADAADPPTGSGCATGNANHGAQAQRTGRIDPARELDQCSVGMRRSHRDERG